MVLHERWSLRFGLCLSLSLLPSAAVGGGGLEGNVYDTPLDDGRSLSLTWETSMVHVGDSIRVERRQVPDSSFVTVTAVEAGVGRWVDDDVKRGVAYAYRIVIVRNGVDIMAATLGPAAPRPQWFNGKRVNVLVGVLILCGLVIGYVRSAKRGRLPVIRHMPGLDAVEEAVGRATEMGRPVLYTTGIGQIQRIATIASMNILASVAEKTARYGTTLLVPCADPIVLSVAQEAVKEGFARAGRPDGYRSENVFLVTADSQFGYAGGVIGTMTRQKTAAHLLLGTFAAEALLMAETGRTTGALQVAGTDSTIQLAFFIVTCDYVLIGEELFAASGYLTKEPTTLGSIRGQDIAKLVIAGAALFGAVAATVGWDLPARLFEIG